DADGRDATVSRYPCLDSPDSIPTGIAILGIPGLLVGNESVSLRTQRIDLEDVSIAPVTPGVDHDLEIVIQFLTNIPAQLRGYGTVNSRIVARDYKVNFTTRIEHSYFRSICCSSVFDLFNLFEIGYNR